MKHMKILKVAVVGFALLAVTVLAGGIASAAPGPGKDGDGGQDPQDPRSAKLNLIATAAAVGASGEAELRRDPARQEFEFQAKVEGLPGLTPLLVSFCVNNTLIDTENPDGQGRVELAEDEVDGDPVQVFPGPIAGNDVTIEAGPDCNGTVLLQGSVP